MLYESRRQTRFWMNPQRLMFPSIHVIGISQHERSNCAKLVFIKWWLQYLQHPPSNCRLQDFSQRRNQWNRAEVIFEWARMINLRSLYRCWLSGWYCHRFSNGLLVGMPSLPGAPSAVGVERISTDHLSVEMHYALSAPAVWWYRHSHCLLLVVGPLTSLLHKYGMHCPKTLFLRRHYQYSRDDLMT